MEQNKSEIIIFQNPCTLLNTTSNITYGCTKWTYNESQMKSTIITEYDFVCKKNYRFELIYTIEQTGYIFGAIVFSLMATKFGKRPVYLFILVAMSILGFIQYWIKDIYVYMAIGFFINAIASGIDTVCMPIAFEMIKASERTRYGMFMSYIWVVLFTGLAPLAYLVKTWRELRLIVFLIIAVLAIMNCLIMQESITWLISSGRLDEVKVVIKRIAKINRLNNDKKFKENFSNLNSVFKQLSKFNEKNKMENNLGDVNIFEEIFKHKKFLFYLFLMVLSW
jgi:OCT family organic cation transporter-like MFS transporter 4/5